MKPERFRQVYMAYDHKGRLIYVGSTGDMIHRMHRHRRDNSAWLPLCAHIDTTLPMDPDDAIDLERTLIADNGPPFNVVGGYLPNDEKDAYWAEYELTPAALDRLRSPHDAADEIRRNTA